MAASPSSKIFKPGISLQLIRSQRRIVICRTAFRGEDQLPDSGEGDRIGQTGRQICGVEAHRQTGRQGPLRQTQRGDQDAQGDHG